MVDISDLAWLVYFKLKPFGDHGESWADISDNINPYTQKDLELTHNWDVDVDIEIEACGVCGSDVHTISGGYPIDWLQQSIANDRL